MKYKHYSLIAFLSIHFLSNAQQVPNAGLDVWTNPKTPDGWYTYSSSSFIIDLAGRDSIEKVEGKASAKIHTALLNSMMVYEILSLGTADYNFKGGNVVYNFHPVYFPFRPDTLFFAYKYTSSGVDTATAYIKLIKGNAALLTKEISLIKSSKWTYPYILLTPLYLNAFKPDSLLIQFKSSKTRNNFFGVEGSTLNIDDVHFGYAGLPSSAKNLKTDLATSVLPNPFSNQLSFTNTDNEPSTVFLHDFLGRQILQQKFINSVSLNTELLVNGIYFYELRNSKGTLKTGKVIKQ